MHDIEARTLHRLTRFVDERLDHQVHRCRVPVSVEAWQVDGDPVSWETAVRQKYAPFEVGSWWGRPWGTTWFRVRGTVPRQWQDEPDGRPEMVVDLGYRGWGPGFTCEGQVWSDDGQPLKSVHPRNRWVPVPAGWGEEFTLHLEAAANPLVPDKDWYTPTPAGDPATAGEGPIYELRQLELCLLDLPVWELQQDVAALKGLVDILPADSTRRAQVVAGLGAMLDAVDPLDLAHTAPRGRAVLAPLLARHASDSAHVVHAVGHAHIDSAWLWPVRETVRKCVRTFGNVCDLMDRDPDLVFACSSAQQYEWVRDAQPELFERLRNRVAEGRFVPVGGMWVESDTNLPGGEALVRQFLLGTQFFLAEFGVEPLEVWLPDSFGYSAAMPQIARQAGKHAFLTQKISWNDTNRFPHHSFWWRGIDGTRIFTHFPPADTYTAQVSAQELHRSESQFSDKGHSTHALLPFGWGDGGGGPTREMLASARRFADLEGAPRVVLDTPSEFFAAARAEAGAAATWTGELYLEYHRGTYTSQHAMKTGNRRCEHLLREAELWWTVAEVRTGASYPSEQLRAIWKRVLLLQFHDILPGSSIAWVHRDAERWYAELQAELEDLVQRAIRLLAGPGHQPLLFNPCPVADGSVPALSAGVPDEHPTAEVAPEGEGFRLRNDAITMHVDAHGHVASLVDRIRDREIVPVGAVLGQLHLHRDMPNEWDAWDINHFYRDVFDVLDDVTEMTPVPGGVHLTRRTEQSTIAEAITLEPDGVRFTFDVDWHERQRLLKLDLPLDLHAEQCRSEIQFGHLSRPTTTNTSWDQARFETVAHRWLHVGEADYGVAVANSATYGYDVNLVTDDNGTSRTVVRPSLLRAPLWPDPEADQGLHHLEFLLVPNADISAAVTAGYRMNLPRRTTRGGRTVSALLSIDQPGVVVECVKLAEDGSRDVVARLYESRGARCRATVAADFPVSEVLATDLLERPLDPPPSWLRAVDAASATASFELRPFQLATLRFVRKPDGDVRDVR